MGLGIIQNLPAMPLDDQWETIQNWEERHDALETHLERIVSKFFDVKIIDFSENKLWNDLKCRSCEKINSTGSTRSSRYRTGSSN